MSEAATHITEIPWWVFDRLEDKTQDRTNWITGGLGSGKTYGTALWHIQRCFDNYKSPYSWIVGPTYAKLESIYIPAFIEAFYNQYRMVDGVHYSVVGGNALRIKIKRTGQEILGHSANKWRLMVGENISHWSATEVGYYPSRDWYDKCQSRARCPKAEVIQGQGEGTPEGTENWYAEAANFDEIDLERNATRTILHTEDNAHLRPGYVEKLKQIYGYDLGRLESYLYGRFVPFTKGTAYWEFLHSRNVVLDVKPSKHLPLLLCWDFNKSPLAWVVMQRQPFERGGYRYFRYVALAESSGKSRGVLDACAEFIAQFDPKDYRDTPIHVYGDCSGYFGSHLASSDAYDQINQALRSRYRVSILAARSAPSIEARLNRVNTLMAYEQYVVAAWCRNLIKSHTNTGLKKGMWQIEKPSGEDWTHYSDATGYPLFQLTREEDLEAPNKPRIFGTNLN